MKLGIEPNWKALNRSKRRLLAPSTGERGFVCPGCGTTWRFKPVLQDRHYVYKLACTNCETYSEALYHAYVGPGFQGFYESEPSWEEKQSARNFPDPIRQPSSDP